MYDKEYQKKLYEHLTKKRLGHSISVAYTAACLGMKYNINIDRLYLAGLLHDCAKYDQENHFEICDKVGIELLDEEKKSIKLPHAPLGAYYAKTVYGVEDEEILSAIRWHTLAKKNMTTFEKIIFIADKIELNRKALEGLEELRYAAFENLDQAIYLSLYRTNQYLKTKGVDQSETSKKVLDFYEKATNKEDKRWTFLKKWRK